MGPIGGGGGRGGGGVGGLFGAEDEDDDLGEEYEEGKRLKEVRVHCFKYIRIQNQVDL
jgi:hypothetical protein